MTASDKFIRINFELTIRAGVYAKFPPIAVKLKGETAAMNPSIPRYRKEFFTSLGLGLMGE